MIAETYVCYLDNGNAEYGYTLKQSPDSDDSEFDIVLGQSKSAKEIDQSLASFKDTANRIAAMLSEGTTP